MMFRPITRVFSFQFSVFSLSFLLTAYSLQLTAVSFAAAEKEPEMPSDQQISEFSLSGYAEKGKKNWDISGKTADIFTDVIKLDKVVGNMYGKEEDIKLTADKGDFNKAEGKVHLERNVVITTSTGTKLTTDSLDWDRKAQQVSTKDAVNIKRENMVTVAQGASSAPNLKKINLDRDVQVDILPVAGDAGSAPDPNDKTTITSDGPLQIDYGNNLATFNDNVKVVRPDSTLYSDKLDIYFLPSAKDSGGGQQKKASSVSMSPSGMANKINKIVARGNVKVVQGQNISYSEFATYSAVEKKLLLTGRPKLIIYSTEGLANASLGN